MAMAELAVEAIKYDFETFCLGPSKGPSKRRSAYFVAGRFVDELWLLLDIRESDAPLDCSKEEREKVSGIDAQRIGSRREN